MHWLWLALLTLTAEPPASATIQIELKCAVACTAEEVELSVIRREDQVELQREKLAAPGRGSLTVSGPLDGLQISLHAQSFWALPSPLGPDSAATGLVLELWPRGDLVFVDDVPPLKAGELPARILVEAVGAPLPPGKKPLPRTRLACTLADGIWTCPAPALALDLRLEKPLHVPRYFFGKTIVAAKKHDLGRLRFEKGASISGFVTVEEGEPKGAEISVLPSGTPNLRDGQRHEFRTLKATTNERGFFQIFGVAPGGYRLEATRADLTTTELWPVEVREEQETAIPSPIHLPPAVKLVVHVTPPVGPLGKPWKMTLVRRQAGSNNGTETLAGETDDKGVYLREGLRPGVYFLIVSNPDGEKTGAGDDSIWLAQEVNLLPGEQPLYLDVPTIDVEGTFRAGSEPLRGRLIFGGFHGAPHVVLWSDEDGNFEGQLPREGEWDLDAEIDGRLVSLEKVLVEPRGGRPARLDIRLANTRFHGIVRHRDEPVEGAKIWGHLQTAGNSGRFNVHTDEKGEFDVKGLAAGSYDVTVSSARLRLGAPRLRFEIREGAKDPPVEIELEEFVKIEGQVLAGGQPVPGATFAAWLRAKQGEDQRDGQTDASGVLGLLVPESTSQVALLVAAPGFAWQVVPLRPSITGPGFAPVLVEVAQNGGRLLLKGKDVRKARLQYAGVEMPVYLLQTLREAGYHSDSGGGVLLENATPGHYRVCRDAQCVEGVVSPGGSLELELDPIEAGE